MSRQDPGAANGQVPTEPKRCVCKHLVTFHGFNAARMRARCTRCDCRLFVAAEAVSGRG